MIIQKFYLKFKNSIIENLFKGQILWTIIRQRHFFGHLFWTKNFFENLFRQFSDIFMNIYFRRFLWTFISTIERLRTLMNVCERS
jgi:hypothetical protein